MVNFNFENVRRLKVIVRDLIGGEARKCNFELLLEHSIVQHIETVTLAGDSFLGCSLQGNVWHSPARGPVRPERKDRSQVWILGDGIEIRSQNTTGIACNENQYMPSTVKIREGYRPPYLTEESVVQPEKHRKKQPTNRRKSQPSDSYILATEEKTKL